MSCFRIASEYLHLAIEKSTGTAIVLACAKRGGGSASEPRYCSSRLQTDRLAHGMAYYFKSKNAVILPEGSAGAAPRPWAEVRDELLSTPVVMRAVYAFLTPREKLPHCAVCKRFRADIGAAPLDVSGSEVPRFLRALTS